QAYKEKWDFKDYEVNVQVRQHANFYSDDGKIRVILNNLIGNAYKFQKEEGEKKAISLEIDVLDDLARIKVSDNGIGIEEKHQKDVFNLFHRATQKNVGSGLGLYMVKESVEQIEGEILLQSTVPEGTVVEITLPNLQEKLMWRCQTSPRHDLRFKNKGYQYAIRNHLFLWNEGGCFP